MTVPRTSAAPTGSTRPGRRPSAYHPPASRMKRMRWSPGRGRGPQRLGGATSACSAPYKRTPSDRGEPPRPGMITGVRTLLRYLGGAALVGLLVAAGTWVRVGQIGAEEPTASSGGGVEAIVVLGAAQYDGDPSPVFRARLDHAAQLYRDGVAPRIVTIGGGRPDDVTTEGQAGAVYLTGAGIDPAALVAVGAGADTLASLRAADGVLAARGWTSVVLVTDPPHAARSALMARDLGWSVQTSPVREGPAVRDDVRAAYLLRETLGILYYRVAGGPSGISAPVI